MAAMLAPGRGKLARKPFLRLPDPATREPRTGAGLAITKRPASLPHSHA